MVFLQLLLFPYFRAVIGYVTVMSVEAAWLADKFNVLMHFSFSLGARYSVSGVHQYNPFCKV